MDRRESTAVPARFALLRRVWRPVLIVGVTVGAVLFLRRYPWRSTLTTLTTIHWGWFGVALAIKVAATVARGLRAQILLGPIRRISLLRLTGYYFASHAADNLFTSMASPAVRVILLSRRDGIATRITLGLQLVEKLLEVVGLAAIVVFLVGTSGFSQLPAVLRAPVALVVVGAVASLALLGLIMATAPSRASGPSAAATWWRRLVDWARGVAQGGQVLHSFRGAALSMLTTLLVWALEAAVGLACLSALGLAPRLATSGLALLAANLAFSVPGLPGGMGTFEASTAGVLHAVGEAPQAALAFAVVYHVVHVVPALVLGLTGLRYALSAPPAQAKPACAEALASPVESSAP